MKLDLTTKHKAFLGFRLGAKAALPHIFLRTIEAFGNDGLIFTVAPTADGRDNPIHISRVLLRGTLWVAAADDPYAAGQEAGEIAARWWRKSGFPGISDVKRDVDPDFEKWMELA